MLLFLKVFEEGVGEDEAVEAEAAAVVLRIADVKVVCASVTDAPNVEVNDIVDALVLVDRVDNTPVVDSAEKVKHEGINHH